MSANPATSQATDAAVNDVANTLAATSIADKEADAAAATSAAATSAAEGRRLYIGNLAYATKEGDLKDFFKAFLVESVSIPKNPRTEKPVGYAFVDVSTPNEAENAIRDLSGQEVLGRKVSVQLARKPEAHDANGEGSGGETRRRPSGRGRGRARGRGGRGGRGGRAGHEEHADENAGEATAPEAASSQPLADVTNTADNAEGKGAGRMRRERGPPADGIQSKTKVMVANLPYELSEEKLKELFAAYEPQSAKIALRPIPRFMIKKLLARGEPRKGRGFGFVTLASEEMQQKAIEEMNGKVIDGREIAVKVAIDSPDKTDDHHDEEAGENGMADSKEASAAEVAN